MQMNAEQLDELRDRAEHITSQLDVLQSTEGLVAFFRGVTDSLRTSGVAIRLDDCARLCHKPTNHSVATIEPLLANDKAGLWPEFLQELHDKMYPEFFVAGGQVHGTG